MFGDGGGASLKRSSYQYSSPRVHVSAGASYVREKWVGKKKEIPCSMKIPKKNIQSTTHYCYNLGRRS